MAKGGGEEVSKLFEWVVRIFGKKITEFKDNKGKLVKYYQLGKYHYLLEDD